jgi:hypothetical protein
MGKKRNVEFSSLVDFFVFKFGSLSLVGNPISERTVKMDTRTCTLTQTRNTLKVRARR